MTLLGPGDHPRHRVLEMDNNRTSVVIGRSSKTASKGLEASVYNAWFDSPVMSRMHARLELNVDDMVRVYERLLHGLTYRRLCSWRILDRCMAPLRKIDLYSSTSL